MKKIILVAAVLIGALIVVVPSFPQAQTTHTKTLDRTFDVYYGMPCANGGLGEERPLLRHNAWFILRNRQQEQGPLDTKLQPVGTNRRGR